MVVITIVLVIAAAPGVLFPQDNGDFDNDDFDDRDLFAEIFGAGTDQDLVVPVYRNREFLGEVQTLLSGAGEEARIGGAAFESVVEPFLNAEAREALSRIVGTEALIPVSAFREAGLTVVYGPEDVELTVRIDPDRLRERTLGMDRRGPPPNIQTPVDFSGYTNLFARGQISSRDDVDSLGLGFEPVVNYRGWVGEASMAFSTAPLTQELAQDDPFTLRYARVVRDFPREQIRGEAGLVRYQRGALMNGPEILGFSATRLEESDPDTPLFRREEIRFVVPRYAPVEVYLNERRYRRDTLNEGPFRLTELPLGRGVNRIRVEQVDDTSDSPRVLLEEDVPFSPQLLFPGRHFYSGGLGMIRDRYEADALFVSGTWRYGLLPRLTLGGDIQAGLEEYALGIHSLLATGYGLTRGEAAVSLDIGGNAGVAAELSHVVAFLHNRVWPVVEVTGLIESRQYQRVLARSAHDGRFRGGVSLNQRLPGAVSATVGLAHTRPLVGEEDPETALRVSLSHQSPQGYSISIRVGPRFSGGSVEWSGGLFFRFGSPDRRINTTTSYDLVNQTSSLQVGNIPAAPFGTVDWSARYRHSAGVVEDTHEVGGTVRYNTYRTSTQVQPEVRVHSESENDVRVSGQFATAVVWAGPVFALSRTVRDSFVLFTPTPELEGERVPLRPGAGTPAAVLHGRAAVVPDLTSWTSTTVRVDGSLLPDGLSVGERDVSFRPGYRTGYLVEVGSAATVFVTGRLVDGDGEPLALEAGEVFRIDEDDPGEIFFTNRDGLFEIPELRPGSYRLVPFMIPDTEALFTIPAGERGRYNLEDVVFLTEESP